MARTVNEQEYIRKRNDILDAAMRLVFTKGYERMTIGDILADLKISSGAFYHYFDSKPALLEAFIQRIRDISEESLLPVIHHPRLSAIEKLQGFFDALERLRMANRAYVADVAQVWYTDDNAIVRQKVEEAIVSQRAPLFAAIVRQGIEEGVFALSHPSQAGEVLISLLRGMENTHARMLLSLEQERDMPSRIEDIVAAQAAYMEAMERVLGAPSNSLRRADADMVRAWMKAQGNNGRLRDAS